MSTRTFKLTNPHLRGEDVKGWQRDLRDQLDRWQVDQPVKIDGDYGVATRSTSATVLYGLGISTTQMKDGITPQLRIKVRNGDLTAAERKRYESKQRKNWRDKLRNKDGQVAPPLAKIISSSWGYHPPTHDGVDLICRANAPLHAICDGKVLRADEGGWWGKGAPSPAVAAKGDGIIVIECAVNTGPFKPRLRFCYGHAEHPTVKVGERVRAGDVIGKAGFANAWHIHFMVNGRRDAKGVGDRDPMVFVRYSQRHA